MLHCNICELTCQNASRTAEPAMLSRWFLRPASTSVVSIVGTTAASQLSHNLPNHGHDGTPSLTWLTRNNNQSYAAAGSMTATIHTSSIWSMGVHGHAVARSVRAPSRSSAAANRRSSEAGLSVCL
jgi:hypothetical protein